MSLPLPMRVWQKALHQDYRRPEEEVLQGKGGSEKGGDVLILGLWEGQNDSIIDVIFGDSNTDTNKHKLMEKIMTLWEKKKKNNHGNHFQ